MTYHTEGNEALETKLQMKESIGDYVRIQDQNSNEGAHVQAESVSPKPRNDRSLWLWWGKRIVLCILLGFLIIIAIKWAGPFFMNKQVIPIINWEMSTFSTPVLAIIIFASVALFPVVFLPSTPSMWVAGMTFGYGIGFLLVMAGVVVGMSLPYFIGSLFRPKIQGWLEKHPDRASIIRLASEGDWFHQFRAIALIRISPFPYVIFNYAAVATDVKYSPYLLGSFVGMVPEVLVALYSGILIWTVADATQEHKALSTPQIILNAVGFSATLAATVTIGVYAKKKLDRLQEKDEGRLVE